MKVLILCTGNSCRSQMAEGFLKSFNNKMDVFSAGGTESCDWAWTYRPITPS